MNFCQLTTGNRQLSSTSAERAQKNLFMQNKPNFPRFCAKNSLLQEKQTQFKPNQSQFKPNSNPISTQICRKQTQSNPIKPNFKPYCPGGNYIPQPKKAAKHPPQTTYSHSLNRGGRFGCKASYRMTSSLIIQIQGFISFCEN